MNRKQSALLSPARLHSARISLFLIPVFCIVLAVFAASAFAVPPGAINVTAGSSILMNVQGQADSALWAGIVVTNNNINLTESVSPFLASQLTTPQVIGAQFPGGNFVDGNHQYIATLDSSFNTSHIQNITTTDIARNGIFNSSNFPWFYPNYDVAMDSPVNTFCCNQTSLLIGGTNFSVFTITLANNYSYYLGKYIVNGSPTPMFVAPVADSLCFNGTACTAEFFMPVSNVTWDFFAINQLGAYQFTVYVDGVPTTTLPQTAKPYNITIYAYDIYASATAANLPVAIGETDGHDLFLPYRLSGYVATGYSIGHTDGFGYESFLVTPTVYVPNANYTLFVSAAHKGILSSMQPLGVGIPDQLDTTPKLLSPNRLLENTRTVVNSLRQVATSIFRWSNIAEQAKTITVTYDLASKNFTVIRQPENATDFTIYATVPTVLTVGVQNNGTPVSGYTARITQTAGYLLLNPYTDNVSFNSPATVVTRSFQTNLGMIIVPTQVPLMNTTISLDILSGQSVVATTSATIASLSTTSGVSGAQSGVTYSNDMLKTAANAMNQILYSLFVTLNP